MVVRTNDRVLGRDDCGPGSACAKAVDKNTCRGVGTSVTARIPIASVRSGAGRRPSARPAGARTKRSKPNTPRTNVSAASAPPLRRNPPRHLLLRRRVVTQQNFFPDRLCDRPGCYEPVPQAAGMAAYFCCPDCRQALRRVLDRERKWLLRAAFPGRRARQREYDTARLRRRQTQHPRASPLPPPAPDP
jgi:hypothetical protein